MQPLDTTVKNYTVQMPAYLWDFLNERAKELNCMTGTFLSTLIFRELETPTTLKDVFNLIIKERLYPRYEKESIQQLLDIIDNESLQISDLMPEEDDFDMPQQ